MSDAEALAAVMSETDGAEPGDGMPVTFYIPWATAIIAALPPDVVIVSVSEVAERLAAQLCSWYSACDSPERHRRQARRLLGLDER